MSTIKAIVFDAVGTLIYPSPAPAVVYAEVGRRFGSRVAVKEVGARFAAAFRRQEEIDHAAGLRTSEARELRRWRAIVAEVLYDVADAEACFRALYEHFSRPDAWACAADVGDVLAELSRRGYQLALASNYDSRLRTVHAGVPALAALEHLVISAEVGWRKPAPQFFAALCSQLKTPPAEVLFVGDARGNDYDGPRAAGLPALLYDPRGQALDLGRRRIGSLSDLVSL